MGVFPNGTTASGPVCVAGAVRWRDGVLRLLMKCNHALSLIHDRVRSLICRKIKGTARLYSKRELKKLAHCWEYMSKEGIKVKGLRVILGMEKKKE